MYQEHWGLNRHPFATRVAPEFFHRGDAHWAALLKLRYVLENRLGAALLVGGTGSGKSYLIDQLAREMPDSFAPFVKVEYPHFDANELLHYIADGLDGNQSPGSSARDAGRDRLVRRIESRFALHADEGRCPVIVIDEAHQIEDPRVLQTVQLLLNFQSRENIDFALILVGERSLVYRIQRFEQLDERIAVRSLLRYLTRDETADYVAHRLRVAGRESPLFGSDALDTLFELSGGVPRKINRLCDLALLVGYADGLTEITPAEFTAASEELVGALPD